jgi:hypothetical protein
MRHAVIICPRSESIPSTPCVISDEASTTVSTRLPGEKKLKKWRRHSVSKGPRYILILSTHHINLNTLNPPT